MNIKLNSNENTNPIISITKMNVKQLIIRAFQELIPVIPDRFEEYNKNIGLSLIKIDQTFISQENINNQQLISYFSLDIDKRNKIIIETKKSLENDSIYPPDYYAIILIQSFCAILLIDINTISFDLLINFLNGFRLGWSCLPLQQDLYANMFMLFYTRFLLNTNDKEYMFTNLPQIDKIGSEFAHCFLPFTSCLIDSCNYLFNLIFQDTGQIEFNFNQKVSVFYDHFAFILKSINWKVEIYSLMHTVFENIIRILPMVKKENILIVYQFLSFITFAAQSNNNDLENDLKSVYVAISDLIDRFIKENEIESNIFPKESAPPQNEQFQMKEMKYFEFLTDDTLTFSEDLKLSDYEYDPSLFSSLFDKKTSTIAIISDFFYAITNFYSLHKATFDVLIQICKPKIESGDLNYQSIIQLYVSKESKNMDKLCSCFESSRILNTVLFNQYLFDSKFSLFDYKVPTKPNNKVLMRIHLFYLIKNLISTNSKSTEIFNSIIFLLNFYMSSCQMFTEIVFLLSQLHVFECFPNDIKMALIELISSEISVQQQWHSQSSKKAEICRPIMLTIISQNTLNSNFNESLLKSKDFVKSFFSLIFDPDFFNVFFELFCKLTFSYIQSSENDLFNYLQPVINATMRSILNHFNQLKIYQDKMIQQKLKENSEDIQIKIGEIVLNGQMIVNKQKRMIHVFSNFILVLQFLINDGISNFINLFVKFQLFEMFTNIIPSLPIVTPSSDPSLFSDFENLISVIIDIFEKFANSPMVKKNIVNYNILIKPIQTLTITENIYNKLRKQVCHSNTQFKSIEKPEVLQLLIFSTENSDYFPQLLNEISIMCRDSIWNCFSVFNSGILIKLLELVDLEEDQSFIIKTSDQKTYDILEIILNLFCLVNIFVSSRQHLYAFIRLFHVFDDISFVNTKLNEENKKTLSPHLESYMNCFRTMFTIRSHIPSSFIHFVSSDDYVEMKSPLMRELMNNGFTVSLWLLLDNFNDDDNAFSVLFFKGKLTTLNIYLTKNSLCMTFINDKKVIFKDEIDISFPCLEWFNLTLNYDKENGLLSFVNGKQKNSIERPLNFLIEDFQTLKFHGKSDNNFNWMRHCQISILAVFVGGYNSTNISSLANDIFKFGSENVYSISSLPNLYSLYSAFKARGNTLINYKEGYGNNVENAKFKGSIINFVASFCQVFESSNGAAFIAALWSLIGLKYPDGNEEKRLISWISQVMETVCQHSEISQSQLIQINASQVISYFIRNLPDERINSELWGCFNRLFKNATNSKFKRSLCTNILFNYHIWIRSSISSAIKIYDEWRNFIQTVPFEYWEKVSIKFMIDILRYYLFAIETNSETNSLILTICLCMYDISLQNFSFEDAETALKFCVSVKSTQTLLSILKLFENVFYNRTDTNPYLFYDLLLKETPLFFTEANDSSKEEIMLLFQIIYEHENNNLSILIDFIFSVIYQKQSRSQNALFLMKQYMAKSIGTNSINFDKSTNFEITSISSLYLAIFSAIFVDQNERINQMTPFLGKISAFPNNQIKISKELDKYSILILVFYGIVIDLSVIPFISAFLFRDINNLYLSFLIIDAFERFIHFDLTNQIDIFISHCISLLIANPTIQNRRSYFELFMSKLFYHRKIGDFSWAERIKKKSNIKINFFDFLIVAEKRKLNPEMNEEEQILSPSYHFGCLIQNNQWNEIALAKSIFQFLIILLNEDSNAVNPSLISSFIFCLTSRNADINPHLSQLSQLITILGQNFISEPFLLNMSLRKPSKQTDEFMKKHFNRSSITPSISLYVKTNEVFEETFNIVKKIINTTISSVNSNSNNDSFFNSVMVHFVIDFFTKLTTRIKKQKQNQQNNQMMTFKKSINSDKSWKRLVHKLRNERSPLLAGSLMNKTRHYKRPSYFDFRFRPILLTPNEHFDIHSKASELALQQQQQKSQENETNSNEKEVEIENDGLSSTDIIKLSNQKLNLNDDSIVVDENVKWSATCMKINVLKKKNGTFSVFSKGYQFTDESGKRIILKADSVLYIFWRWNLLIPNSVEIFMDNHKSYFFSFIEETDHSFVNNKLLKITLPNKIFVQTKPPSVEIQNLHLTEKWLDYSMSTFDYLMALNMFGGRSFLNLSCYPVFPWILVDYASPSINIHSKPIYRDFKIPVGALNTQELERKKERMEAELEAANAEYEAGSIDIENYNELLSRSSFLFQTGYSNQFIVTYYMLRLEPFTTHHISLMDGRFDNPNRLFNSVPDSFMMLITTNSAFRELIPEFFFQPEFLLNSDKFNFGMTLKKKIVNNVELPAWSKQPIEFIHKHILALESEECGFEISNWIDLIFGYKQTGQNAVESNNTFDPHMYVNNHFKKDDVRTNHVRELIGQIPIQLFETEHPKRQLKPSRNPPFLPKKITLNLSGSNNETNSSSFVVTSLNIENNSLDKLKIYSVHKNGKLFVTKLIPSSGSSIPSFSSTCILDDVSIPTDPRFISTCSNDSTFVCSLNDGNGLLVFQPSIMKNGKSFICEEKPHIAAISCISISSYFIITGGCDASVVLWLWDKKKVNVIANSVVNNDTITAVCASKEYGIAISCSRDGIMTIFRLPHLDFIRNVNFNPQENLRLSMRRLSLATPSSNSSSSSSSSSVSILSAHRVMVTKGMGYIVAFLKNENEETTEKSTLLRSYTINGQLISSSKLECEVIDAMTVSNKSMIDFIFVLTDQPTSQELLLIDAYSLNVLSTIVKNSAVDNQNSRNEPKITKFSYHEGIGCIVLAYDNSEFAFVPFMLP